MMESKISRISKDDYSTYQKIRDIITKTDFPASSRKTDINVGRHPSFSMDPIMNNFVGILNRHWCNMFYVLMVSWVDLDDDKLPFCSPKWKLYGWRMMTTIEKKTEICNSLYGISLNSLSPLDKSSKYRHETI